MDLNTLNTHAWTLGKRRTMLDNNCHQLHHLPDDLPCCI